MRSPAKIEHGVRCCASRNVLKCHGCPYHGEPCCREQLLKDVQDYLKAIRKCGARIEQQVKQLEAAQPKWISATAEHPKNQAVVLIYCNDGEVGAARYEEEYGCFVTTEKGTWKGAYGAVTHWMPLPSAPKEEV